MIQIKSKDGLTIRCEIKSFSYNGAFMGDRSITITYKSPEIIPFAIGDYVEYREEKFVLDYDPSDSKEAEVRRSGDAITYNLTFHPESHVELQNCDFCDYVLYDNQLHYSSSPKFSFIGTAHDLADRIKANLDRLYPGKWTIKIDPSVVTEDKSIEIENTSCWNAVVLFNKEYGLNFTVSNRTVKVGFPPVVVKHTFNYGINNGLYKIERNVNSDEAIITRLKAYGADRNIPKDYNKLSTDIVPKKNLMLPGYKETGIDYIDSDNISIYGIRPQSVVFDDIYPSIEGVEVDGIGRIDEIVSSEQVTADTEAKGTFTINIKDIGFDINDYLVSGETATISIKNGSLLGYEFEIVKVEKLDTGGYELTLNKSKRDNWQVPNKDQNLQSGNRFVLLHIRMPEKYVTYAEEKLLKRAKEFLARYDHVTYTYNIGVDEIFMARNISLYEEIMEGDKLPVYDADLLIDYDIIIQSLVITEGDGIPLYKISLSDQPVSGTIDKMWDAINNIKNQGSVSNSMISGGGGTSPEELNRKYLRKDVDDTAKGNIYLERNIGSSIYLDGWEGKGWRIENSGLGEFDAFRVRSDIFLGGKIGSPSFASGFTGWGWEIDTPTASGTVDNWTVRKSMRVYEMVYSQIYGLNSSFLVSDWNKIKEVSPLGTGRYRITIDKEDNMLMNLRKGDIVRTQVRENGGWNTRYYVALVENVTDETFDLKILEGTDVPIAGDYVQRIGSDIDKNRQGLIYFTSSDDYAPYIDILDNVTGPQFTQDNTKVRIGNLRGITINGKPLDMHGIYINGGIFQHSTYYTDDGNTIEQRFEIMDGKLDSSIEEIRKDLSEESGNILRNSSFSSDLNYWEINPVVHFINASDGFLWLPSEFYVDKEQVADIYRDGNRNVLRIRNSVISQPNGIMNVPEHESEEDLKTYSFSLYYKVLRPGTYEFGIPGTDLYASGQMDTGDTYQKLSKVGKWNGKGDFKVRFSGEILIYGLNMFSDAMADAIIKLETQIEQTSEHIKLLATKEYVDGETNKVYLKYDGELKVTAENISAVNTRVDNINNRINTAGWITSADSVNIFAQELNKTGIKTSIANLEVKYNEISSAVSDNEYDITNIRNLANSAASEATKALTAGIYGQEQYSQTNDPWQNWQNGTEYKHVGALWYNPSTGITKRYTGTDGSDKWETVSNSAITAASYVLQNKDKWSLVVANFDSNGNPTEASGIVTTAYGNTLWVKGTDFTGNTIASKINQSATTITIDASKINLNGAVTANNYFKINTDGSMEAKAGKIGGFKIGSSTLTSDVGGYLTLNPSTGISFTKDQDAIAIGPQGLPSLGGSALINLRTTASAIAGIMVKIGNSTDLLFPRVWVNCQHETGWGSSFRLESRYFGDGSSMERTCINVGKIMSSSHVRRLESSPNFIPVYYDDASGFLCAMVD